jgi:D-sedoheptulose 7-phosphate isomerase
MKFRIFVLCDELTQRDESTDDVLKDRTLVDELKNVASPGDVVVGIYAAGSCRSLLQALEYADKIGCRTVCVAGSAGGKLAAISQAAIVVPASHSGNVEDTHMIVCRMIGQYFISSDPD